MKATLRPASTAAPTTPLTATRPHASGLLSDPLPGAIRGNNLRTLPGTHPGDGFFAALFERKN